VSTVTQEAPLEVRNIYKAYGPVKALKDVSFTLHRGEVLGLLGDNGAGKSTMVKCLSGMLTPDEGQVLVHGEPARISNPMEARRVGIETVHQDLALIPYLDVAANMFLNREVTKSWAVLRGIGWLDKRSMYAQTRGVLDRLHVRISSVRMRADQLSGGQRQAVAVSRAVVWSRDIVLLDEPTAALGVEQSQVILDLIKRMSSEGIAVVLVSHNMQHVVEVCTRAIVLRLGVVMGDVSIADATPSDLVDMITGASVASEMGDEQAEPANGSDPGRSGGGGR
jgi:simple sugar transport system ATP-binding protein